MIEAYPLAWPVGWPRMDAARRIRAKFHKPTWTGVPGSATNYRVKRELSVADGVERTLLEIARLGARRETVVISTNLKLRQDGLPLSNQREPADVGVAVYWHDDVANAPRCMAIDLYDRIADNLGAVAATIEAMRAIERHGGAQVLARAFTGFTALPAPGQTSARGWQEVMEFGPGMIVTRESLDQAYRRLRSARHPDKGGTAEAFNEVQVAYEQGCDALASMK